MRRDVERLYPNFDENTTTILIDGVPTNVRLSPTRTRFIGANELADLAQRLIDSQGEIA